MAISGVNPKCYILALFVRDDGTRFLLGDDPFEFKDNQLHFQQNTMANDVVEVQGNDGYLLAGQVRRPGTQVFDGYVCNGTNSKEEVEAKRRSFLQFFRRSHFYKVIYVFPNGTAIQRKQGFLVDDPTVQELYQQYPEYHVALNFEDVNYYTYEEDDQGHEIYAKEAIVPLAGGGATGGLIWDNYGVVWEDPWSLPLSISGVQFQIINNAGARAPIKNAELYGDTFQQTYSGKNLFNFGQFYNNRANFGTNVGSITVTEGSLQYFGNTSTGSQFYYAQDAVNKDIYGMSNLQPSTEYTVSYKATANTQCWIFFFDASNNRTQVQQVFATTDVSMSFTTPANMTWYSVRIDNRAVGNNTISELQIEAGSTPTDYEPYVGGVPAPNPDYPQAMQTVTGEQTVDVWGKNLFNYRKYTTAFLRGNGGGVSVSNPSGNILRASNKVAQSNNFVGIAIDDGNSLLGKTVTASADVIAMNGVEVTRLALYWIMNSGLGSQIGSPLSIESTGNYVLTEDIPNSFPSNATGIALVIYGNGSKTGATYGGDGTYVDWENIQFEFGSSATQYEKYQWQTYGINLGKNLFVMPSSQTVNGVTMTVHDDGTFDLKGKASATGTFYVIKPLSETNLIGGDTYTLHIPQDMQWTLPIFVQSSQSDGTYSKQLIYGGLQVGNSKTAVLEKPDTQYVKFIIQVINGHTYDLHNFYVQLEEGSTATPYAPYFEHIELCKIGDYQDYIYKGDDGWYLHKEVRHLSKAIVDMDNSENFPGWKNVGELTEDFPPSTNINMNTLTDSCDNIAGVNIKDSGRSIWDVNNLTNVLYANRGFFGSTWTQTYWKTNYPNLVVDLYYGITNTPSDTKITDATLVSQLEALGAMELFIGENNFLVSANGSNLPATLEFDYYSKFAAIGAEWEEGGTKGATIVDVDAIDNTYPVWELTGPATNPTLSVLTTNTALTYNGTITASQKLVIDMFNKTATLNGTSVIGNVSGDFVYMAPGSNRVAYTAGNADAPDSTIYWQEVVG